MKTLPLALLCLLAVSCVPGKRREVGSPSELGSGEVLLIGRIKVTPPITKDEQSLPGVVEDWRYRVMVLISDQFHLVQHPVNISDYRGRIEAPPDREFSVAIPANSFWIRGGVVPLHLTEGPRDEALLPGGIRVELRPDDHAVYIGTIHYTRDEFWQIKSVKVEDEYDRVCTEIEKRWDPFGPPRKALITLPSPKPKQP